jgi:hypothetical protein
LFLASELKQVGKPRVHNILQIVMSKLLKDLPMSVFNALAKLLTENEFEVVHNIDRVLLASQFYMTEWRMS